MDSLKLQQIFYETNYTQDEKLILQLAFQGDTPEDLK